MLRLAVNLLLVLSPTAVLTLVKSYFSFILEYLLIEKDNEIIAEHTFEKYIHNKSFDLTGNCNFIHKI